MTTATATLVCWCGHPHFAHNPDGAQACEIRRCPCRRFDTRRPPNDYLLRASAGEPLMDLAHA